MTKQQREQKALAPFSEYLRTIRQVKGWTIRKVEQRSGISNAYICQLENGLSSPTIAMLKRLADAYGMKRELVFIEAARRLP